MPGNAVAVGNVGQPLRKVGPLKMQARKIAGYRVQRKVAHFPAAQAAADLLEHIKVDACYQAVALKQRNKAARQQQAPLGMIPAHKRLAAYNGSGAHIHLGLMPHLYFSIGQRFFQLAVKLLAEQGLLPHTLVVEHHGNARRALGFKPGIVGHVQHELHIIRLRLGHMIGSVYGAHRVRQGLLPAPLVQLVVHFAYARRKLLPAFKAQQQYKKV